VSDQHWVQLCMMQCERGAAFGLGLGDVGQGEVKRWMLRTGQQERRVRLVGRRECRLPAEKP
jgi:hypothetical protein